MTVSLSANYSELGHSFVGLMVNASRRKAIGSAWGVVQYLSRWHFRRIAFWGVSTSLSDKPVSVRIETRLSQ